MPEILYDYVSVPTIREFSRSDAAIRGLMGPFGSGKSSGCVVDLVRRAMAQTPGPDGVRRTRWAVIRNTFPQLRDTTIRTFHQWLPPRIFGEWRVADHEYTITKLPDTEIQVLFRALDRPDHISNLLSLELTGAWVNEAREVPWSVIRALLGRVGRYPAMKDGGPSWSGVWFDTNPPDDESWWFELFEDKVKPGTDQPNDMDVALFKQPSGLSDKAENLPNLKKGYYQDLASMYDEETAKVYIHGEYGYIKDGKPVFPEYVDSLHCGECKPVPGRTIYRGWDFGLTPACIFTQILPNGQWIIFDEMWDPDSGIDRFGDSVNEYCSREYPRFKFEDIADPAGSQRAQTNEKSCFDILKGKGIMVQPGTQDLTTRIESVRKPMRTLVGGNPQLLISQRCKMLRKGFQGRYQYKRLQVSAEKYHEKPDKNDYSHVHDALQYVATKLFESRLKGRKAFSGPSPQPKIKVI